MPDVVVVDEPKLDLLVTNEPALSSRSDMPVVETKPDSQPAPVVEAKVEAATEEVKKAEESAPPEEPEGQSASDEPKRAQGVQKRLDELTRNWREAERREAAANAERLRLLALVEQGGKPAPKPDAEDPDPEPQRPARDTFADTAAYEEALNEYADSKAAWSAKRAVKEVLAEESKKAEQRQVEEGQKAAQQAYAARVEKAAVKYQDYKAVAESPDVSVSMPMAMAIMQSEHGPDIAYHLGKNPEEAKRISALNPALQLVEVGLIVAKLTAPAPAPAAPAPKPPVSNAPKPIKPLESKSESSPKSPEEMSMDEYAAMVKKRDRVGARH